MITFISQMRKQRHREAELYFKSPLKEIKQMCWIKWGSWNGSQICKSSVACSHNIASMDTLVCISTSWELWIKMKLVCCFWGYCAFQNCREFTVHCSCDLQRELQGDIWDNKLSYTRSFSSWRALGGKNPSR